MRPLTTRQVLIKRDTASPLAIVAGDLSQDPRTKLEGCEVWREPRHRHGLTGNLYPRAAGWPWEKGAPHVSRMIAAYRGTATAG